MTKHAMQNRQNTRLGIGLMAASCVVFALQDGVSRHLGAAYPVQMVVMIRFWFFALFVIALAARAPGGIRAAIHTKHPVLQPLRGLILVVEVAIMVVAFVHLGLIETHAVFTCYPLLVAALSGPVLGEKVGWRRWTAIAVGFAGVMRPISTSCVDHMGASWARIHTWDGQKWNFSSDWYQADEQIIKPMVKAAADKYAAEKKLTRRDAKDCQS